MRIYEYGNNHKKSIMIFKGAFTNNKLYEEEISILERSYYVLSVSYTGFTDNDQTTFKSLYDETIKIEEYIKKNLNGKVDLFYGTGMGETIIKRLLDREEICVENVVIASPKTNLERRLIEFKHIVLAPVIKKRLKKNISNIGLKSIYTSSYDNMTAKTRNLHLKDKKVIALVSNNESEENLDKIDKYYDKPKYIGLDRAGEKDLLSSKTLATKLRKIIEKKDINELS